MSRTSDQNSLERRSADWPNAPGALGLAASTKGVIALGVLIG
jgi:hypothetical protein